MALDVLHELRAISASDDRLIVTGPPGPHNPANEDYLDALRNRRSRLSVDDAAHFFFEPVDGGAPLLLSETDIAARCPTCVALLFPGTQEGFGMPML